MKAWVYLVTDAEVEIKDLEKELRSEVSGACLCKTRKEAVDLMNDEIADKENPVTLKYWIIPVEISLMKPTVRKVE